MVEWRSMVVVLGGFGVCVDSMEKKEGEDEEGETTSIFL